MEYYPIGQPEAHRGALSSLATRPAQNWMQSGQYSSAKQEEVE
ncbi:hypothetical protein WGT02_15370 [Rhizobium sp. T1470]|uniref:Uncharacterized protein n=1 Tax=Rhizobium favelukesii TaxID=348824 RepID=W6RE19_9HYPH|nr:hypothetical protein [Rhizobium sp. T1473]CDM58540.1 hypothetical protein LPU83_2889 [Rhizobium favelukesii]